MIKKYLATAVILIGLAVPTSTYAYGGGFGNPGPVFGGGNGPIVEDPCFGVIDGHHIPDACLKHRINEKQITLYRRLIDLLQQWIKAHHSSKPNHSR